MESKCAPVLWWRLSARQDNLRRPRYHDLWQCVSCCSVILHHWSVISHQDFGSRPSLFGESHSRSATATATATTTFDKVLRCQLQVNGSYSKHITTALLDGSKSHRIRGLADASSAMSRSAVPSKRPASDAQEAAWVADEDRFVLQQAKKKAAIRVKGGRAQPIDWLAVILAVIDPARNPLDDEVETEDLDLAEPESVFEGLSDARLLELEKGIDTYLALEKSRSNQEYWTVCLPAVCYLALR